MSQTDNSPDKNKFPYAAVGAQALAVGMEVGCLTVIIVLAAVFGGLWLDKAFGTKPLLTLLFVIGSAPLALALTFWLAKRAVKPMDQSGTAGKEPKKSEGEKPGE